MLSYYCLKCRKNTGITIQKLQGQKTAEQCFHKNLPCVIVKNQNLLKRKKLVDY